METSETNEDAIATIKDMRKQLESRIETQHATQIELFSTLQNLVPDIVSTVDLSLQVISFFNNRPFSPTPLPPPNPNNPNPNLNRNFKRSHLHDKPTSKSPELKRSREDDSSRSVRRSEEDDEGDDDSEKFIIDESGNPLTVVRSMVADCLLQRVPFVKIDSSAVLWKLENDHSATAAEKAALRELGGESGGILAVEMALRSMAEDNGGVELKEFVLSGKSRVMVSGIDRSRLVKELPESSQQQDLSSGDGNQSQKTASGGSGAEANGGFYGMGGPIPRPMPDMWPGPGDSHMSGLPPMFPGTGPSGPMMGPRGGAPRVMSMMGMPRGMGLPSLQRPQLMNVPNNNPNAAPQRMASEEDELKDLEAMLNKKSFREKQKSKTGEELLDLIHRPTAKETAVAAKVFEEFKHFGRKTMHALFCNTTLWKSELFFAVMNIEFYCIYVCSQYAVCYTEYCFRIVNKLNDHHL